MLEAAGDRASAGLTLRPATSGRCWCGEAAPGGVVLLIAFVWGETAGIAAFDGAAKDTGAAVAPEG